MKRLALFTIVAFSLVGTSNETKAGKLRDLIGPHRPHEGYYLLGGRRVRHDRWNLRAARVTPWHANYNHTAWGRPLALVVPPTARTHVRWGWGVAQSEVAPIYHQYRRPFPQEINNGEKQTMHATPTPATHTDQFGAFYIRAPW